MPPILWGMKIKMLIHAGSVLLCLSSLECADIPGACCSVLYLFCVQYYSLAGHMVLLWAVEKSAKAVTETGMLGPVIESHMWGLWTLAGWWLW